MQWTHLLQYMPSKAEWQLRGYIQLSRHVSSRFCCVSHICACDWQEKTGLAPEDQDEEVSNMVKEYVRGLCWVMHYYYEGDLLRFVSENSLDCHLVISRHTWPNDHP